MVILGLGSNVGDRLNHLRKALHEIKKIPNVIVKQVSPVYISDALMPDNAPSDWDMPYLNLAIRCETNLSPADLLKQIKIIELSIGRKPEVRHWGPRIIDIDILAVDDVVIQTELLTIPHVNLQERPFALWPLADIAPTWKFPLSGTNHHKTAAEIVEKWGSRFSGDAPYHTKQINHRVDTAQFVGIVNVTPDSFSDGGEFLNPHQALHQILHLAQSGAEIIDIGAESTTFHAQPIDAKMEWQRLQPVLEEIKNIKKQFMIPPKISVDTRHSFVAEKALEMEVDWINDVTGLNDNNMCDVLKNSHADCVVMHSVSIPTHRDHILARDQDNTKIIYDWAEKKLNELERFGIKRSRIILDPGIGFGKTAEHSLLIIKNISLFKTLGVRILVGHSRKSFLSLFTNSPFAERDIETVAITNYLIKQPVDYIRVHNVDVCAKGLKVAIALDEIL